MKILVAIDHSPATDKVLAATRQYASLTSASIWLLHVVEPDPAFVGYEPGPQVVRDQVAHRFRQEHDTMHRLAGELRDAGVKATALVTQGPTSEAILKEANQLGVDLIIIGSHGHGAMYQLIVGSVSEGVIRGAPCPILVVPAHRPGQGGSPGK
jgi:nucleotide-binding universal stress UspA family protein